MGANTKVYKREFLIICIIFIYLEIFLINMISCATITIYSLTERCFIQVKFKCIIVLGNEKKITIYLNHLSYNKVIEKVVNKYALLGITLKVPVKS